MRLTRPSGRDYLRTCRACGAESVLPRRLAKARSPGGRSRAFRVADVNAAGVKSLSRAYMQMLNEERARRAAAADLQLAALENLRTCQKCGSKDFDQHRLPRTPRHP